MMLNLTTALRRATVFRRRFFATTSAGTSQATVDGSEGQETATAAKRNISGLRGRHAVLAAGGCPPIDSRFETDRAAVRARFGKFGLASGVDPGTLWPTVEEVEEERALGLLRDYRETLRDLRALRERQAKRRAARLAELERNDVAHARKLEEWKESLVKAEKEKDEREIELEKKIRSIQEYFGYWIDPKDPRFEVMYKQKEEEEKKAAKEAKKAEKAKKMLAQV